MTSFLAQRLDDLSQWRARVDRGVGDLGRWLKLHEVYGEAERTTLRSVRERLRGDRLMVAFVAEFSRGKSELINALLFAQTGQRILPAAAGRTTMCPVELRWDIGQSPELALLPIATRREGLTLADLREHSHRERWTRLPLDPKDPAALAAALQRVTETQGATVDESRALGLWNDEDPDDRPPQAADGTVEVPRWRHAVVNWPHPLLEKGLVVLDTPGLNAIGAEPELTLGLLPACQAAVFVLGADTGVTRSDLGLWRDHLASRPMQRYVVLNKIDTLADPLAPHADVAAVVERQRESVARALDVEPASVFALSAREAVVARAHGRAGDLQRSRLPDLEVALGGLVPAQHEALAQSVREDLQGLQESVTRALADRRRQHAEQLLELRSLRGKSQAKVRLLQQRVEAENEQFEQSAARLAAVRAVQVKMLRAAQSPLTGGALRSVVGAWQPQGGLRALLGGGARDLEALFSRLRDALRTSRERAQEIQPMLVASFEQLNAEFGFAFIADDLPDLDRALRELDHVERNFRDHLSTVRLWRARTPEGTEQFRNLLLSRVRFVFEGAADAIEQWARGVAAQFDTQLGERRRAFRRRRESLERIRLASDELEGRIAELEGGEQQLRGHVQELQAAMAASLDAVASLRVRRPERAAA